jgi:hypothetical protein
VPNGSAAFENTAKPSLSVSFPTASLQPVFYLVMQGAMMIRVRDIALQIAKQAPEPISAPGQAVNVSVNKPVAK